MTVVIQPPIPAGVMHQYAGATAPSGYLLCDGSAVSRTTYAALFAVLSTTYGSGDGSTTFTLPDMRGRMPMGAGTGTGLNASGTGAPSGTAQTARTRGQWGGEETHLLTGAESGTSAHGHGVSDPGHVHNPYPGYEGYWQTDAQSSVVIDGFSPMYQANSMVPTTGSATTGLTVSASTAANASSRHAIVPPFVVTNYIIKT
jgi:microcystin-dependent protein